jgi:hypothetical protein
MAKLVNLTLALAALVLLFVSSAAFVSTTVAKDEDSNPAAFEDLDTEIEAILKSALTKCEEDDDFRLEYGCQSFRLLLLIDTNAQCENSNFDDEFKCMSFRPLLVIE